MNMARAKRARSAHPPILGAAAVLSGDEASKRLYHRQQEALRLAAEHTGVPHDKTKYVVMIYLKEMRKED